MENNTEATLTARLTQSVTSGLEITLKDKPTTALT
jgi:hypothetical protein